MTKRVAIIGAGCSGLAAVKCCLEEDLLPTCFEASSDIGGLWNFTDEVTDKRGSVMSSTVINTSKEMMAFSDFPAPKEFPNFMPHSKVLEYFRLYAEKFSLLQYIRFNSEVVSIRQVEGLSPDIAEVSGKTFWNSTRGRIHCCGVESNNVQQSYNYISGPSSHSCMGNLGSSSHSCMGNLGSSSHSSIGNLGSSSHSCMGSMSSSSQRYMNSISPGSPLSCMSNISSASQSCMGNISSCSQSCTGKISFESHSRVGNISSGYQSHVDNTDGKYQGYMDNTDGKYQGYMDNTDAESRSSTDNTDAESRISTDNTDAESRRSIDNIDVESPIIRSNSDAAPEPHNDSTDAASPGCKDNVDAAPGRCRDNIKPVHKRGRGNVNSEPELDFVINAMTESTSTAYDPTSTSWGRADENEIHNINIHVDQTNSHGVKSPAISQNETNNGLSHSASPPTATKADDPEEIDQKGTDLEPSTQWEIRVKEKLTHKVMVHYFDCVLVCTGHHADINMPYFPGQSTFKGHVLHSRDVRRANQLTGSRHVVVGVGNSGCDMAVELSRVGKVYLSTRRGTWLMQRLQKHGLPADVVYMSRFVFAVALKLPKWILNKFAEFHLSRTLDHSLYGLRPNHGPFATHPTVNDELPNRIACGQVVIKPNIDSFTESGVRFEDGTSVDDVDWVVMATGYKIDFPFLDQSILEVKGNQCPLYLYMFPPTVTPPTLAVIGCVQAEGALFPVSEMQCRLAARVFKNLARLPSQRQMLREVAARRHCLGTRYIPTQRHTIQVDFLPYMDELATAVGCRPKLGRLLVTDPRLAITCVFGPCTAYQYRLTGPHAWSGARNAIMTQMDRIRFPFGPGVGKEMTRPVSRSVCLLYMNIILLGLGILIFYCIV